jgi:hypothetical protein
MNLRLILTTVLLITVQNTFAVAEKVYFVEPQDGAEVSNPIKVKMGVVGLMLKPITDVVDKKSGHHHLIIDGHSIPEKEIIPADDKHLHFGKGETETTITLPPGEHSLTLQFANGRHES